MIPLNAMAYDLGVLAYGETAMSRLFIRVSAIPNNSAPKEGTPSCR